MKEQRFWKNLTVGVLALSLLGTLTTGHPGFLGWELSPFLLLVLWMAVHHGWIEAGLTAALSFAISYTAHPDARLNLTLLAGSALYVGGLADASRRRIRALRYTVVEQAESLVSLGEREQVLERANGELRAQLSEQQVGLATLYEIYRRISGSDRDGLPAASLDSVADYLSAEQCSYYSLEDSVLKLQHAKGWTVIPEEARRVPLGEDLLSKAVQKKELQTLQKYPLERLREQATGGIQLRLMAAPILHPRSGSCLGVIAVESLPFSYFTRPSARLLETIAELTGQALVEAPRDVVPADGSEWLSQDFFARRLRNQLVGANKGTLASFALVVLRIADLDRLDSTLAPVVERAISTIQKSMFRTSDLRGRVSADSLGVLLPDTSAETARLLTEQFHDRITQYLGAWLPELGALRFETSSVCSEGLREVDELIAQARATARPGQLKAELPLAWSAEVALLRQQHKYEQACSLLLRQVQQHPARADLRNRLIRCQLETPAGSAGASEHLSLLLLMSGER